MISHTMVKRSFVVWILLLVPLAGHASDRFVPAETRTLFVPVGFDDNDEVIIVVDGYLPDPCHTLRQPQVKIDRASKVIQVTPMVERVSGACPDMTVPYTQVVNIGTLAFGEYSVRANNETIPERLTVKIATNPGPDDYLYAPVDSAEVTFAPGTSSPSASIRGRFTNSCLVIHEVRVIPSGKTLEVLPLMRKLDLDPQGRPCLPKERPFETRLSLPPLEPGRYLLHVRSLNGQSVNEVFSKPGPTP